MKGGLIFTLVLSFSFAVCAQHKPKNKPFIIKGKITNCPEKYLNIYFRDKDDLQIVDTLWLDASGAFYFQTFRVEFPQIIEIQKAKISLSGRVGN